MNLTRGIDLKRIAAQMNEASGAESKAVCTEAGMFALRERRVHVTQDDFEMAVAKVMKKDNEKNMCLLIDHVSRVTRHIGHVSQREEHVPATHAHPHLTV